MNMTERAFVIDKQLQQLLLLHKGEFTIDSTGATKLDDDSVLSMQAIVNAIVNPHLLQSKRTRRTVNRSSQFVNWYSHILVNYTNMHSTVQVAASSTINQDQQLNRQGRGFSLQISLQSSPTESANLVVSVDQATHEQLSIGLFMHCTWEQQLYVVPLGVPIENKAQVLVSVQDKAFNAITHPESHLYLT